MVSSPLKRSSMALYAASDDPYSHRVRIVLAEKGLEVECINIDEDNNALEELASFNPYGSVPTLVDRDLVLFKSEIIMEYLDERFPHPSLLPVLPVAKGRARLMMHRINTDWYNLMDKIQSSEDTKEISLLRKDLSASLTSINPVFAEHPYFFSEEFSLVDCCIAPLLWRLPQLGVTLPPQAHAIAEYADRIFARESFKTSLTETERMMRK